jgi:hypothetical protein
MACRVSGNGAMAVAMWRGVAWIGAADLDDARLGRAGAAVVVVVLALAELAAARAAADVAVGRVVAADLLAHDQAGAVDQGEEGLALGLAQEQVVGRLFALYTLPPGLGHRYPGCMERGRSPH